MMRKNPNGAACRAVERALGWTVVISDADRVWLRAMMYALHEGYGISGDDRKKAKEFEKRLAPKSLAAENESGGEK